MQHTASFQAWIWLLVLAAAITHMDAFLAPSTFMIKKESCHKTSNELGAKAMQRCFCGSGSPLQICFPSPPLAGSFLSCTRKFTTRYSSVRPGAALRMSSGEESVDCLVLGGGLVGMAAAFYLKQEGGEFVALIGMDLFRCILRDGFRT